MKNYWYLYHFISVKLQHTNKYSVKQRDFFHHQFFKLTISNYTVRIYMSDICSCFVNHFAATEYRCQKAFLWKQKKKIAHYPHLAYIMQIQNHFFFLVILWHVFPNNFFQDYVLTIYNVPFSIYYWVSYFWNSYRKLKNCIYLY